MTTFDQDHKPVKRLGKGGLGVMYLLKRKVDGQVRSNSLPQKREYHRRSWVDPEDRTPLE
jgi:hypothetical protein